MSSRINMEKNHGSVKFYIYLSPSNEKNEQAFEFSEIFKNNEGGRNLFDRIINCKEELNKAIITPTVQDVTAGYNCFLFLSDFTNSTKIFQNENFSTNQDRFNDIASELLTGLFSCVSKKDLDRTLHVSIFDAVNDGEILDCLSDSNTSFYANYFDLPNQPFIEIQDLTMRLIAKNSDIVEVLRKSSSKLYSLKVRKCSHAVMFAIVLQKSKNVDGLEFLKAGRITLVELGSCFEKIYSESQFETNEGIESPSFEDNHNSQENILKSLLRNAMGRNVKSTIVFALNAPFTMFKNEFNASNVIPKLTDVISSPKINKMLIIRNSLKEYAGEINEMQKDIIATKNKDGILLCSKLHRGRKNFLIYENENLKFLKNLIQSMVERVNSKKDYLKQLNQLEIDVNEKIQEEKVETISAELEKLKNVCTSLNDKLLAKVSDVVSLTHLSKLCVADRNTLRLELAKLKDAFTKSTENIQHLNKDLESCKELVCMDTLNMQNSSEEVLTCLKNNLEHANAQHKEVVFKLSDLTSNAYSILNAWKHNLDTLLSNLHIFIKIHNQNCVKLKNKIAGELLSLNESQKELVDIMNRNKNTKMKIISSFCSKIRVSIDASVEILSEVSSLFNVIQARFRKEIKVMEMAVLCSGKELKHYISDLNSSLKKMKQFIPDLEKDSIEANVFVCNQQLCFKKSLDEEFQKIKNSLKSIRELHNLQNDCTFSVWNKRQEKLSQIRQNSEELTGSIMQFQEKIPTLLNNLHYSSMDYQTNILEDSNENHQNMNYQLRELHTEMRDHINLSAEENKMVISKEEKEVNKFLSNHEKNVTGHLDNSVFMVKVNMKYVSQELQSMQKFIDSKRLDFQRSKVSTFSLLSEMEKYFTQPLVMSQTVLIKSEECLKIIFNFDSDDSEINSSYIDYFQFESDSPLTSTPSKPKQNFPEDKEVLFNQLKKLVTLQITRSRNKICDSKKKDNVSTASLPNLGKEVKVGPPYQIQRSYSRLRTLKK